jgi:hypothetical protein
LDTTIWRTSENNPIDIYNNLKGREIWLSPVIQATWEARIEDWLEVYTLHEGNGRMLGSALGASTLAGGPDVPSRSL